MKNTATSYELRVARKERRLVRGTRDSRLPTRNASRRGILLLVVLSMLTLFLLMGTAFIVSSNQYRQANKARAKLTETSNSSIDQQDLLNEVINQLVRDTNNANSSIRFHSLLRDMYGNDGLYAHLFDDPADPTIPDTFWASANPSDPDPLIANPTNGQMIQFTLDPASVTDGFGNLLATLSGIDRAYNGLVLTFIDGAARGQSVRIVGHTPIPVGTTGAFNALLRVMTPRLADGSTITDPAILDGARIAINGRPFNGTGAGYDLTPISSAAAKLTAGETLRSSDNPNTPNIHLPVALMPNSTFFNPVNVRMADYLGGGPYMGTTQQDVWEQELNDDQRRIVTQLHYAGIGGADESYDAVDFQNMPLALLQTNPVETVIPNLDASNPEPNRFNLPGSLGSMPIPSFHRPALLNYWRQQLSSATTNLQDEPNLLRKVLLRPNWFDHPNFNGSNPDFVNALANSREDALLRSIYGPWDVDNDLDGVRDSVWIDAGLPVMANHDGRLVKPLVSVLVVDMDGRLNLNAHGSEDIAASDFINFALPIAGTDTSLPTSAPTRVDSDDLPHGIGYGPAEISLDPLMSLQTNTSLTPLQIRRRRWLAYQRMIRGVDRDEPVDLNDADATRGNDNTFPTAVDQSLVYHRRAVGKYGQRPNATTNPLPGIDDVTVFDIAGQLKMQGVPLWADGTLLDSSNNLRLGGYATPPDFRGRYALGLNPLGQPVYEALDIGDANGDGFPYDRFQYNTGTFPEVTQSTNTPYEVDLSLGGARGESVTAPDGPYTVAELERILRPYDSDAGALPSRIWDFAGEFKDNPNDTTPNLGTLNLWRTTVTTDSYDLPVPSVLVPSWMLAGPDGIIGNNDDYVEVMNKPAVGASFADLLEYRMRVVYIDPTNPTQLTDPANRATVLTLAQVNTRVIRDMGKLLPPDLANGLRLDLNRPLGNGRDDNNNGVVDEPGEWDDTADNNGTYDGEFEAPYWASDDPQIQAAGFTGPSGRFHDERILLEDRDNDLDVDNADRTLIGVSGDITTGDNIIDTYNELVSVHNMRRQTLARDLYIMAMTLADPLPVPTAGPTDADYLRKLEERAKQLAQWAINVVDFRDPDNIMTAFEYDSNPFDGWSPDGNLATLTDIYGTDAKLGGSAGTPTADQGGLVWGAERPELLITETLGWHDRATENTNKEDPANDENFDTFYNDDDIGTVPLLANADTDLPDTDYDQRLRPRGAAFIELYCPWPENPASNADIRASGQVSQRFDSGSLTFVPENDWDNDGNPDQNGADMGVNLAAVSSFSRDNPSDDTDTTPHYSPCWRLMMYKDGGPGLDPNSDELELRPQLPDRSVYFTDYDPNYPRPAVRYANPATAHPDENDPERYVNDGVAFFRDPTIPLSTVQPGGYMVVGAGEQRGDAYVSKLTSTAGSLTYLDQGISLNPITGQVLMQSSTGASVQDPDGFQVNAIDNVAVAIINQSEIGQNKTTPEPHNFTFSEPANGYPDRVEGSRWEVTAIGRGTTRGRYVPTVDIPLDDQRAEFAPNAFTSIPLGTGGFKQSKVLSELNDGETRLTLPGFRIGGGFNAGVQLGGGLGNNPERNCRTIPGFKWVYLQRLANPLLPWNPEPFLPDGTTRTPGYDARLAVNPYMTIDSMGANVTVFTGVSEEERRVDRSTNPETPILSFENRDSIWLFSSLQRGRRNSLLKPADPDGLLEFQEYMVSKAIGIQKAMENLNDAQPEYVASNLWNPEPIGYIDNAVAGLWKNESGIGVGGGPSLARDGVDQEGTNNNFRGIPDHTLGFLNEPFRAPGVATVATGDQIEPQSPFSWLTWNNRPFANSGEVMQVPAFGPSQLLSAYSMRGDSFNSANDAEELYAVRTPTNLERNLWTSNNVLEDLLDLAVDGPFGHLLNFFRADSGGTGRVPIPTKEMTITGLYRVLDYVHVSSPYVGSETWLNPATFGDVSTPALALTSVEDPRYHFQPPFNKVSSFREPGRVNLNTVVTAEVWEGGVLHRELQTPGELWNPVTNRYRIPDPAAGDPGHTGPQFLSDNGINRPGIVSARRGYGENYDPMLTLSASKPTFFTNPFRAADAYDLVPVAGMLLDRFGNQRPRGVGATLLRNDGTSQRSGETDPVLAADTSDDDQFNDANRNSYFRYQPISRMTSMTTNRSNVYAVWVTIGFFEVQEAPNWDANQPYPDGTLVQDRISSREIYDRVYPEGYMFGQEAGSDTGDIRRVREFAMIDRTIPVAFEPGENHNIDKAIRLRRRIE